MNITVQISAAEAIRAGRAYSGVHAIALTESWLGTLSEAQRNMLAQLIETKAEPLTDSELVEPTLEALNQYLAREVHRAEDKRRADEAEDIRVLAVARDRIAKWLAMSDEDRLKHSYVYGWKVVEYQDLGEYESRLHGYAYDRNLSRLESQHPEIFERVKAETKRLEREAKKRNSEDRDKAERLEREKEAAENAAKEVYRKDREQWIEDHGSDYLKSLAEEGIPLDRTYRGERRDREFPGFDYYQDICGELVTIRDASPEAIRALRELREQRPDAQVELKWLADGEHLQDCGHGDPEYDDDERFVAGPVLTARLLGRIIVCRI